MEVQETRVQLRQPQSKALAISEKYGNQSIIKSSGLKHQTNPFLSSGSKFKIDTTINGQKFLSFSILSLSSIIKKQPSLGKLEKSQKRSSVKDNGLSQNYNQKQVQKAEQIKISCQFCDKKIRISRLQTHLKSCNEAAFCKICQQYILKTAQKEHKYVCKQKNQRKVEPMPHNFYDLISTILDRQLQEQGIEFVEKKAREQNEIERQSRLGSLKKLAFKEQKLQQAHFRLCIICCSNFSDDQSILQTNCGHRFHEACIRSWIDVKQRCPTCNQRIVKQEE